MIAALSSETVSIGNGRDMTELVFEREKSSASD
jgi:hypothetical protein